MNYLLELFVVIILLLLIFYYYRSEHLISYLAPYHGYSPTPFLIAINYVYEPMQYPEIDSDISKINIVEFYRDKSLKVYKDAEVLGGTISPKLWNFAKYLENNPNVLHQYSLEKKYLTSSNNKNYYKIFINGYEINLGDMSDLPEQYKQIRKIFKLIPPDINLPL